MVFVERALWCGRGPHYRSRCWGKHFRRLDPDQPALMVATQAMVDGFHPLGELLPEVPNVSVREVIEHYNLDFIHHVDFNASLVCL